MWEFLGILIITIFKMLLDIARFLTVFVIIVTGFSTAFHLSYSGTDVSTYSVFGTATLTTFLTSPTGYEIPDYTHNVLGFAGPTFGLISQASYVFVGIILLLNLLIALMSETYEFMREQATVEYRWLLAHPFKTGFVYLWPSPFCVFHAFFLVILSPVYFLYKCFGDPTVTWWEYDFYLNSKEGIPSGLRDNYVRLYKGMVVHYFKNEVEEDFDNYLVSDFDSLVESKDNGEKEKEKEKEEE